jgi:hypothetical protein
MKKEQINRYEVFELLDSLGNELTVKPMNDKKDIRMSISGEIELNEGNARLLIAYLQSQFKHLCSGSYPFKK